MQTLTVQSEGFLYVLKCIQYYCGSGLYLALWAAAAIFFLVKGKDRERRIFAFPALMLLITIFNPVVPVVVNHIFDINKEYYRFFWIAPVIVTVAYLAVEFLYKKNPAARIPVFIGITLIFIGAGTYVYADGYIPAENYYKIPNEVIAVSQVIRDNSEVEYPVALCDFNMQMELRQYDASILLAADRTQYLAIINGEEQDDQVKEQNIYVNRLLNVITKNVAIPEENFLEAMQKTNTEFIVLSKESPIIDYLKDTGLKEVGSTGVRTVLHYDLPDRQKMELADYKAFWN